MSEKRFRMADGEHNNPTCYDGKTGLGYLDTIDLLNELNDENQRLKKQNKEYMLMVNANSDLNDEIYTQLQKTEKKAKELYVENKKLERELQRIYDVATVNKLRDIIYKIYDDLLYETSEESDHQRNIVLKCLEAIDDFGDDLE